MPDPTTAGYPEQLIPSRLLADVRKASVTVARRLPGLRKQAKYQGMVITHATIELGPIMPESMENTLAEH